MNNMNLELKKHFDKNRKFAQRTINYQYNVIFHNNLPPGSGKTRNTIEVFLEKDIPFIYLARTHQTVADNVSKKYGLLHIEGKSRLCQNEHMKMLNKKGYSLSCESIKCKFFKYCIYRENLNILKTEEVNWCGVHQHLTKAVQDYLRRATKKEVQRPVLIIDENFLMALKVIVEFNENDMNFWLEILDEYADSNKFQVEYLQDLLTSIFYDSIDDLPSISRGISFFLLGLQKNLIEKKRIREFILPKLLKFAYVIKKYPHMAEHALTKKDDKISLIFYDLTIINFLWTTKVLILDATTFSTIYEQFFKRSLKKITEHLTINADIYQLTSGAYPIESLYHLKTRKRLLKLTKAAIDFFNMEAVIIGRKHFVSDLLTYSDKVNHYDAIRGTNLYEDYDLIILFGAPFRNQDEEKQEADLLNINYELYSYCNTAGELKDCAHRIRMIKKKHTIIVVLTNVDLGLRTTGVHKKLSYRQMLNLFTKEKDIEHSIINALEEKPLYTDEIKRLLRMNRNRIVATLHKLRETKKITSYQLETIARGRPRIYWQLYIN